VLIMSSLPLLRDFGIIVTLNVTIALLSALVLMPPMLVWADQLGMLSLKDQENIPGAVKLAASFPGSATPTAVVGVLAFGGGAVASYLSADTDKGESTEVSYAPWRRPRRRRPQPRRRPPPRRPRRHRARRLHLRR
jgi:hypothetical protein